MVSDPVRHQDSGKLIAGQWIADFPVALAAADLSDPSPSGGRIVAERIVQPFANFMRCDRNVLGCGAEVSSGVVVGGRVGLHRAAECAVITQDAAVGGDGVIEHDVVHQEHYKAGRISSHVAIMFWKIGSKWLISSPPSPLQVPGVPSRNALLPAVCAAVKV